MLLSFIDRMMMMIIIIIMEDLASNLLNRFERVLQQIKATQIWKMGMAGIVKNEAAYVATFLNKKTNSFLNGPLP